MDDDVHVQCRRGADRWETSYIYTTSSIHRRPGVRDGWWRHQFFVPTSHTKWTCTLLVGVVAEKIEVVCIAISNTQKLHSVLLFFLWWAVVWPSPSNVSNWPLLSRIKQCSWLQIWHHMKVFTNMNPLIQVLGLGAIQTLTSLNPVFRWYKFES